MGFNSGLKGLKGDDVGETRTTFTILIGKD
jgi:hypothetical protein